MTELSSLIVPTNEPVNAIWDRVRRRALRGLVSLCCVLGSSCFLAQTAKADFISPYPLSGFTLTNTNADGTVGTPDGGLSINLVGGNNGTGEPGTTDFVTTAQGTGLVEFQWSYFTDNTFPMDNDGGYLIDGVFTQLADTSGESGFASFSVTFGETFGFRVATVDNQGEPGILTVSDFSAPAPSAVPEPDTASIVFLCLPVAAGMVFRQRFNRRRAAR